MSNFYQPFLDMQVINAIQKDTDTIEWCMWKCNEYGQTAADNLKFFDSSDAKNALLKIVQATTNLNTSRS